MVKLNERPHPRALFLGLTAEQVNELEDLFPHSRVIARLADVYLAEFDLLVTNSAVSAPSGIHMVVFGEGHLGEVAGSLNDVYRATHRYRGAVLGRN